MAEDHNPWNMGGSGPRKMPQAPRPPDMDQVAATLHRLWQRFLGGGAAGRGLVLGAIGLLAVWLATGIYRIEPDEQGLVMRFGAYVGSTPPGIGWHAPWPVGSVTILPVTRINHIEIGFRSAPGEEDAATDESGRALPARDLAEESLMLTGDENIVDINASVFWRISDAAAFAFQTRHPEETVKAAAESVLRQVVGRTNIQSALTEGRAAIEQAVTSGTQAILDTYGSGIEITQVQLQKVDPPPEVIEAFRDVQRANTDADTARNEAQSYANDVVPRARGDAAAILAQAAGAKQAAVATATGESERFLSVYAAYAQAKDVTMKRLYIETMQDVLKNTQTTVVDDKLRGVLPMLPLGQTQGDSK